MVLPLTASGEETRVFFGEDGQIKVKSEQVKREKIAAGFLSKTEKLHLVRKITVQNLRKTAVSVDVADRLPVSQNSKIESPMFPCFRRRPGKRPTACSPGPDPGPPREEGDHSRLHDRVSQGRPDRRDLGRRIGDDSAFPKR